MATNFPGSLDSFTNPTSGSTLDSPSHAAQHANINDAVEAVQLKLGTGAGTIGEWTSYTPTLTNFTASSLSCAYARVNDIVFLDITVTVSSVSNYPIMTVPSGLNIASFPQNQPVGLLDQLSAWYVGLARQNSTTNFFFTSLYTGGTYGGEGAINATAPFTWHPTNGDAIVGLIVYRT